MGCDGRNDRSGPRSNAVDRATQVSQIKQGVLAGRLAEQARSLGWKIGCASKESWPEALAEQARSLGLEHWPSKQGVSAWSIGRASRESQLDSSFEQ
jgi:hypothetical protein